MFSSKCYRGSPATFETFCTSYFSCLRVLSVSAAHEREHWSNLGRPLCFCTLRPDYAIFKEVHVPALFFYAFRPAQAIRCCQLPAPNKLVSPSSTTPSAAGAPQYTGHFELRLCPGPPNLVLSKDITSRNPQQGTAQP